MSWSQKGENSENDTTERDPQRCFWWVQDGGESGDGKLVAGDPQIFESMADMFLGVERSREGVEMSECVSERVGMYKYRRPT